jgi:hypothetical protein
LTKKDLQVMIDRKTALGVGVATVLLTGLFAFLNISEWYSIAIMKHIEGYRFGSEGPSPYYYRTSSLYATVTLIWGMVFLLNLVYAVWSIMKDRRATTMIGCIVSIILLFLMFIHGQIGTE